MRKSNSGARSWGAAARYPDILLKTCFPFDSEKNEMGKERENLQGRIEALCNEKDRLQAANAELQRVRDNLEDEKEDLLKDLVRKEKELERG